MLVSGISGNRYHKTDFKAHVSMESKCADHYCKFALSDADGHLKSTCTHSHSMSCRSCDDLKDSCIS